MAISQEEYNTIEEILEELEVRKYTINDDGTVDVDGDVDLSDKGLKEIPVQFGKVGGSFDCSQNKLSSLENAPEKVGGDFYCSYNNLSSLESSPKEVDGDFSCHGNQISSLKGSPEYVGGIFWCDDNKLEIDPEIELENLGVKVKGDIISDIEESNKK